MPHPEVVADNEVPGPEPEGFWEPAHAQVRRIVARVPTSSEFVLDDDD